MLVVVPGAAPASVVTVAAHSHCRCTHTCEAFQRMCPPCLFNRVLPLHSTVRCAPLFASVQGTGNAVMGALMSALLPIFLRK